MEGPKYTTLWIKMKPYAILKKQLQISVSLLYESFSPNIKYEIFLLLHCNCVTKKGLLRFLVKCEQMLQGLTASGEEGDDFCCGNEKCARQAGLIGAGLMTASSAAQWLHTWPTPSDAQLMELSVLPGYSVATISHVHCPTRFDKCANQFTLIVFLFAAAFIFTLARSVDGVLAFFSFFFF